MKKSPYELKLDPSLRTRNFLVKTYKEPREVIKYACSQTSAVMHWAFIKHDKDIVSRGKNKGELANEHFHFVLILQNPCTVSALEKRLLRAFKKDEINEQTLWISPCVEPYGLGGAYRYLTHADHPNKVQYSPDLINSDDERFWREREFSVEDDTPSTESKNRKFLADLLTKSSCELAVLWGRDYIRNRKSYNEFASLLKAQTFSDVESIAESILATGQLPSEPSVTVASSLDQPYNTPEQRIRNLEEQLLQSDDIIEYQASLNRRLADDYSQTKARLAKIKQQFDEMSSRYYKLLNQLERNSKL